MPFYRFECPNCGRSRLEMLKIDERPPIICECKQEMTRKYSSPLLRMRISKEDMGKGVEVIKQTKDLRITSDKINHRVF